MKCYITATELKEKLEAARCEEMKKQSKVTVTGMSISNMSGHDRRTGDNMQFQKSEICGLLLERNHRKRKGKENRELH